MQTWHLIGWLGGGGSGCILLGLAGFLLWSRRYAAGAVAGLLGAGCLTVSAMVLISSHILRPPASPSGAVAAGVGSGSAATAVKPGPLSGPAAMPPPAGDSGLDSTPAAQAAGAAAKAAKGPRRPPCSLLALGLHPDLRQELAGARGQVILMRFTFATKEQEARFISSLELRPTTTRGPGLASEQLPDWWEVRGGDNRFRCYSTNEDGYRRTLWLHPGSRVAFYQETGS